MRRTLAMLFLIVALLPAVLGFSAVSHATLIVNGVDSNGYQLIYDSALNITWYDYSESGACPGQFCSPGGLTWSLAMSWAASLTVGGVSGWTLPTTLPVNGSSYNYSMSDDGSTDVGYNITSPNSEMAYLYYVELGNKGFYAPDGSIQSGWGLVNTGAFKHLYTYYWSETEYQNTGSGWIFFVYDGGQEMVHSMVENGPEGLAVHAGDIGPNGPVPLPAAAWLLAPGFAGLMLLRRQFKR